MALADHMSHLGQASRRYTRYQEGLIVIFTYACLM